MSSVSDSESDHNCQQSRPDRPVIAMQAYDVDAVSLCSSPSSVKVRLRNTFLDFKEGSDSFCQDLNDSPRADLFVEGAPCCSSPLRRSQSDCTGVDKYIRERLGSNAGLIDDVIEVDCDAAFSPIGTRSPISSLLNNTRSRQTDVSILSFSPPTFQGSPMEEGHQKGTASSDFVMIMEEDPPAPRIRPPSISPNNPISSVSTQPNTPSQFLSFNDGVLGSMEVPKTTVMLRNIPNKYTQRMLLDQLNSMGYEGKYDFFYLPIDFRNRCNVGYAFINFLSNSTAKLFKNHLDGYRLTGFNSQKICEVSYARVQGLDANVLHYRNSPVNGVTIPEYRPLLFADGKEIPFPFTAKSEQQF
jgi:hypothetical protein